MRTLALATLRTRWTSFVGVLVTLAAATTLMAACGILLESGLRGGVPPERLSGSAIVVAGHQAVSEHHGHGDDAETAHVGVVERIPIDRAVLGRVAAVAGVRGAVAEVSFPAHVVLPDGDVVAGPSGRASWGHGWSSASATPFVLRAGRAPEAAGEVVVDTNLAVRAGLSVGARARVVAGGAVLPVTVVGLAAPDGFPLRQQAAVFFSDVEAERLHGRPGTVDAVALTLDDGVEVATVAARVRALVGDDDLVVLTGDRRGRAEFLDGVDANTRLVAISGSLGGIAMGVAVFVVAGILAVLVQQRQRELALLRATGATPRQVRRMITAETLVVSVLGAAVGVWPGAWLAGWLTRAMQDKGILPGTFEARAATGLPLALAAAAAVVVAVLAARLAGRRAARVHPVEALSSSAVPDLRLGAVRATCGVLALGGGVALVMVSLAVSPEIAEAIAPGLLMTFVIALGLLGPVVAAVGVRLVGLVPRFGGAGGHLAAVNTRVQARRLAAAITPLALVVAVAGMAIFQQTTLAETARRQGDDRLVADHVLAGGAPGLPVGVVEEVSALPGRPVAVGLLATTVYAGSDLDAWSAQAVTPGPLGAVLDLDVRRGVLGSLGVSEVALSRSMAGDLGVHVGETVRLRLGDGTAVEPRVVAVFDRHLGFGEVVLPWAAVVDHVTAPLLDRVLVAGAPGAPLGDAIGEALVARHPGATWGGPELVHRAEDADAATSAWVFRALLGMVVVFVAIAVVTTLVLGTGERVREFGLLRLVGATRRQVLAMMRWEAGIVVVLGALVGGALAAAALVPFSKTLSGSYVPCTPLVAVLAILAAVVVLGAVATLVPTRVALRRDPVGAIGVRD